MESNNSYNPYASLLPSRRAVAIATWRLGVQPDWDTWTVILEEAAAIEARTTPGFLALLPSPKATQH